MAKTVKRPAGAPAAKKAQRPARVWSQLVGEGTILALIVAVPLLINPKSQVITDLKDAALGLGAVLGLCLWLVLGLAQRRLTWVRTPLLPLALAYLAWACAGVFYSGYWFISIAEAGRLAAGVAFFALTTLSVRELPQVRRIVGAACLVSVPVSIYAFAQASGHDFLEWTGRQHVGIGGAGAERVFSFLGNPTYLGGFGMLIVPLIIAAAWSRSRDSRPGLLPRPLTVGLLLACAVMLLISMYLSFTIAAAIGLGLGALFVLVLVVARGGRGIVRTLLAAAVTALLLLLAAPPVYRHMPRGQQARVQKVMHFQDPFAAERQLHWRTALKLFRQHPVVGEGYGAFRVYSLEQMTSEWYSQQQRRSTQMLLPGYAHNEYLQVLADTGAIGGVLFLALLVMFYAAIFRLVRHHPEAEWRRLGLAIAAASTAFLFQNVVGVTFRQTGAVMFFWLWMGVAAAGVAAIPRQEGDPARRPLGEWRSATRPTAALIAAALGSALVLAVLAWVSITPLVANVRTRMARALATAGEYRAAMAACDATLDLCPYSSLAQYVKAFAAGQLGDYQAAAEANREALKLSPGNASAYYNLGVSYKQLRQYGEAEKCFREAIRLMPIKQHYASLAETLFEAGKLDEAERETRRTLDMDPGDKSQPANERVAGLLTRIEATRAGRAPQAPRSIEELRAALKLQPDDRMLQSQLTGALIRQRRYAEGLVEARRWVQLDPAAPQAQSALGACAFNLGDFSTAKAAFSRQLQLDPQSLRGHLNLAYSYGRLREYDKALAEFQYVAQHAGNSPEGKEAKRVLEKVAPQPRPAPGR